MRPHIPVPCSEDWNKMKIVQFARHCDSCRKNVMDFTQMSRHEILRHLIENRDREVCGRVFPKQLDFRHEEILIVIGELEKKDQNSNLSYFLLTMATLSLAACKQEESKIILPREKAEKTEIVSLPEIKSVVEPVVEIKIVEKRVPVLPPEIVEPRWRDDSMPEDTAFFNSLPEIKIRSAALDDVTVGVIAYHEENRQRKPLFSNRPIACTAEIMPEFEGGTEALYQYVKDNLKYPKREKNAGIEGTVLASFVIDKKGRVSSPEILQSVDGAKGFDKSVRKLIRKMPNWIPASNQGVNTEIRFNMPFRFELK